MKNFQTFSEYYIKANPIQKQAIRIRKELNKVYKKKLKISNKSQKKFNTDSYKSQFNYIKNTLNMIKKNINNKSSLNSAINTLDSLNVDQYLIDFFKFISQKINKKSKDRKLRTTLISKNFLFAHKVIDHPIIKNKSNNPKISYIISKIVTISDPGYNNKIKNLNQNAIMKAVNNILFNLMRDLIIELSIINLLDKTENNNDR